MLMVTVGTGLGGAIVLDGNLVRGSGGFAGEVAHMTAVPDGQWCGCGLRGCLEQYTSGTALVRTAKRRAGVGDPAMSPLVEGPGALAGHRRALITRLAQQGDPGRGADRRAGLAGEHFHLSLLDPDVIVVGGGVRCRGFVARSGDGPIPPR